MFRASSNGEIWTSAPSEVHAAQRFALVRVPPKGLSGAIVLSEEVLGTEIHFWGGRSMPCSRADCKACLEGISARWYGWLWILAEKGGMISIVEITAAAAEQTRAYVEQQGSLRGARFAAQRLPAKPNGRMTLFLRPSHYDAAKLPTPGSLITALERMWNATSHRQGGERTDELAPRNQA